MQRLFEHSEHPVPHDIIQATDRDSVATKALGWLVGLLFSGAIAGIQNWYRHREQERRLREETAELKAEMKPLLIPPGGTPPDPDLRSLLTGLQKTIDSQQKTIESQTLIQDERHTHNLARFSVIENQISKWGEDVTGLREDLRQGRTEMEGLREDTRKQTTLMQTILSTVKDIKTGAQ